MLFSMLKIVKSIFSEIYNKSFKETLYFVNYQKTKNKKEEHFHSECQKIVQHLFLSLVSEQFVYRN